MSGVLGTRDRFFALMAVVLLAGLAWAWLGKMIWDMGAMPMDGMDMPMRADGAGYVAWLVLMWLVMMAAMMLPTALPMTLAYADFSGREAGQGTVSPVAAFIAGYVLAWGGFSLAAALGQWGLERIDLLSPMAMALRSDVAAGVVLIVAGLYQWTPLKHACLKQCRTPIGFLLTEWREGSVGALVMGWRHGLFCVGCCWALMALLFVAGVMNALWIVGLTLFVLIEKIAPRGDMVARMAGAGLAVAGLWLVLA